MFYLPEAVSDTAHHTSAKLQKSFSHTVSISMATIFLDVLERDMSRHHLATIDYHRWITLYGYMVKCYPRV